MEVLVVSIVIILMLYLVRALFLWIFKRTDLTPEIFISPRGLITILLFFAIPAEVEYAGFNSGILLYTILITSIVMALALIAKGKHIEPVDAVQLSYWKEVDKQIDSIPQKENHMEPHEKEEEAVNAKQEPKRDPDDDREIL